MGNEPTPWEKRIETALVAGDVDDAAQALLESPILPAMRRQLQEVFPKLQPRYIDDAVADAVSETFQRLTRNPTAIRPEKLPGYIFNTARYMLNQLLTKLQEEAQFVDSGENPYDPDLITRLTPLADSSADATVRSTAILLLLAMVDSLPSSDSVKQVLRVRFKAVAAGEDWPSDSEVAEVLGREKSSISSWWRRGLRDLYEHCAARGLDRHELDQLAAELDEVGGPDGEGDVDDEPDDEEETDE